MEIILQHTDGIYKAFLQATGISLLFFVPGIIQFIKCKIKAEKYTWKYRLSWIVPVIFLYLLTFNRGLYMIDYTYDRRDVQIVFVEEIDRHNAGCNIIADGQKFRVSKGNYTLEGNVSDVIEEEVIGHTCEIESYVTRNNVIRITVLD